MYRAVVLPHRSLSAATHRKAVVLGSGIVGMCSALELGRGGWDVTVVDRHGTAVAESSFGNAAIVAPASSFPRRRSISDPFSMANGKKSKLSLSKSLQDPPFWSYAMFSAVRGYAPSTSERDDEYARMLHLSKWTLGERGAALVRDMETPSEELVRDATMYTVYSGTESLHEQERLCKLYGVSFERIEPSHIGLSLTQGAYVLALPCLVVPQPRLLAQLLEQQCLALGINFIPNQSVMSLATQDDVVNGLVLADNTVICGDCELFVLATGAPTPRFLQGISDSSRVPIYPIKTHSITVDVTTYQGQVPSVLVRDGESGITLSPLAHTSEGQTRKYVEFSGFSDVVGYDVGPRAVDGRRIRQLVRRAEAWLPGILSHLNETELSVMDYIRDESTLDFNLDWDPIKAWSGTIPATPDSNPIVGPMPAMSNLWINAGHNDIGWVSSFSSAQLLHAMVAEEYSMTPPPCDTSLSEYVHPSRFTYVPESIHYYI